MRKMQEKIVVSEEFRLRLIDLGYKKLSDEEMINRIKQLYIEEYREKLDAEIQIFNSLESASLKGKSGYDGAAIHFYSDKNDVNEVYVISQGTQDMVDWDYNIKSMFAGIEYLQASDTNKFTKEALNKFGVDSKKEEIPVIGLSHSLAHNNNTTAYLSYNTFDKVYSVNGAQTNYYQLFRADTNFRFKIMEHFSISKANPDTIYTLDPKQLEAFATEYYADKADNIHQIISLDDPLYAVSGARGFFTLGEVDYIDTNPDYPGLREILDDIPDHVIQDFQELAIQYTLASNEGGLDAAIYDILGVDMSLVREIDGGWSFAKLYVSKQSEIDAMIRNLNDNVPGLVSKIQTITSNADVIFGRLQEAGYITKEQKKLLVTEITKIEHELLGIQTALERNVTVRDSGNFSVQFGGDVGAIAKIAFHLNAIIKIVGNLSEKDFLDILQRIGESHSIQELLESISGGGKSYIGTDLVLTASKGKKEIRVNMSAALRMYQQGASILQEKESHIDRLEQAVEKELFVAYQDERKKVMQRINDMEGNPSLYQFLLSKHGLFPTFQKKITRIQVHEVFLPLEQADLGQEIHTLRESVEKARLQIEGYRNAIESLFDEDERISKQFDLIRGV